MSVNVPPRSKWSLALYVMAGLLLASALFQIVVETTVEDGAPRNAFHTVVGYGLERMVPALMIAVLGGAIQYLADIRWALLRKLESGDA